mmetsp:Transcript_109245/g.303801  ORF Transcript_109245/g.303801 Transcript_109245/m.303801 type:complete len:160 (+) Transcript_109245:105-584(+)
MAFFCKPLKCLLFLGGRKPDGEYAPVDGQVVGRAGAQDDDEDDFFDDDFGTIGSQGGSVKSQSVEVNPSRETTAKRAVAASSASSASSAVGPSTASTAPKKEVDFFSDLGMEPEYKAPRVLDASRRTGASGSGRNIGALLDDDAGAVVEGWGDDLDLGG